MWIIESNTGKALTCKIDIDGDGAIDKEIANCSSDNTKEAMANLPTFTFDKVGEHHPKLIVTDGERTVEASTTIFSNKLDFGKATLFPEKQAGFVKAEVTPMTRVVLEYDGTGALPEWKAGDVAWGTSGGGYLLKVVTVTKSGNKVTLDGEPGKIEDAIENGFFGAREIAAPMNDVKCMDADCAGLTFEKVDGTSGTLGTKSLGRRSDPLTWKTSGNFGLKIPLPKFEGLDVDLFVGMQLKELVLEVSWFKLKRATVDMRPSFSVDFSIKKETPPKEWKLGSISLGTIPVGPLIITPMIFPTVRVVAGLKATGTYGLNLPFQVKYDGGWTAGMQPDLSNTAAEVVDPMGYSAGGYAELTFVPKVNFLLLGIAGPYVGPTGTLSIEGKVQTAPASDVAKCGSPLQLCFNAKASAGGEYGAELPWVKSDKASIRNNFTIAEVTIYEKCFGKPDEKGNCPDAGGPITVSDSGTPTSDTGGDAPADAPVVCPDAGPPGKPECAKCEHDLCTEGTALAPTCGSCQQKVCAADDYCCTQWWTLSCMEKANTLCGAGCKL
jgi:hypothetical protein